MTPTQGKLAVVTAAILVSTCLAVTAIYFQAVELCFIAWLILATAMCGMCAINAQSKKDAP